MGPLENIESELRAEVESLIAPSFEAEGLDLVELTVQEKKGTVLIRVLADRPSGGITIAECSHLNREISGLLDEHENLRDRYALELSSPGIDRPLRTTKDFTRVLGRKLRVILSEPLADRTPTEYVGVLKEAGEDKIVLDAAEEEVAIPRGQIRKALQHV